MLLWFGCLPAVSMHLAEVIRPCTSGCPPLAGSESSWKPATLVWRELGPGLRPDRPGGISGENFVFPGGYPVQPAQLFTNFAPFVTMLNGFGGVEPGSGEMRLACVGRVLSGFGNDWCFHNDF